MPSTRKQKAKEKRARQSDVMSDIENLDVMLGSYSRDALIEQGNVSDVERDFESNRHQQNTDLTEGNFRSLLNANESENSEITAETMRVINSEISSQMSRKLDEIRSDLNLQVLDAINSAIQEKVLPSIENALKPVKTASNAKWDLQSDGPQSSKVNQSGQQYDLKSGGLHKSRKPQMNKYVDLRSGGLHLDRFDQDAQECDPRSDRPHRSENTQSNLETRENCSKMTFKESNRANHLRESSIDSTEGVEGYDMVTGANLTPHMVPEFLTGRRMQYRKNFPQQNDDNDDMLDTTLPAQQMPMRSNTTEAITVPSVDPINRLADVIMGINSKPSAQTLMVRPVSTTTLTFDGKSEMFELFEDLFHTMIKMQPDHDESNKN